MTYQHLQHIHLLNIVNHQIIKTKYFTQTHSSIYIIHRYDEDASCNVTLSWCASREYFEVPMWHAMCTNHNAEVIAFKGLSRNELIKNWPFSDPPPPLHPSHQYLIISKTYLPTPTSSHHLVEIFLPYFHGYFVIFAQMILHCNILRIEIKDSIKKLDNFLKLVAEQVRVKYIKYVPPRYNDNCFIIIRFSLGTGLTIYSSILI